MPTSGPQVITVDELATLLHIHRITVYRQLKDGKLPGFKIGRVWRFHRSEVDSWVARGQGKLRSLSVQRSEP